MLKRRITQEEKDQYQKDGVVCLRGLFDMKVVDKLRVGAEQCMAAPPSDLTRPADLHCPDFVAPIFLAHLTRAKGDGGQLVAFGSC